MPDLCQKIINNMPNKQVLLVDKSNNKNNYGIKIDGSYNVGRPRIWKSPQELEKKIDEFREYCKANNVPKTIARLAQILGTTREDILLYEKYYGGEFIPAIKKIRNEILCDKEERLISDKTKNVVGLIFDLKNNHSYADRQTIETNQNVNISTVSSMLKSIIDAEVIDTVRINENYLNNGNNTNNKNS